MSPTDHSRPGEGECLMKKSLLLGLGAVAMAFAAGAGIRALSATPFQTEAALDPGQTVYLKAGVWETADDEYFAAQFWVSGKDTNSGLLPLTHVEGTDGIFSISVPENNVDDGGNFNRVLFWRGSTEVPSWGTKYNQTGDLNLDDTYFAITGWGDGNSPCTSFSVSDSAHYYFVGDYNGWNHTSNELEFDVNQFKYVIKDIEIGAGSTGRQFKLIYNDGAETWLDDPDANYSAYIVSRGYGQNLETNSTGYYNFYWDPILSKVQGQTTAGAAEEYGTYLFNNIGCDASGAAAPSGWSDVSAAYGRLSLQTKNVVIETKANESGSTNLEKGLARYDWAVAHNPNVTGFIIGRANAAVVLGRVETFSSTNSIIIIGVALATSVAFGVMVLFAKRRKENR